MGIFDFLKAKPATAEAAKNRLQIIIAEQRSEAGAPDFIPRMQQEILQVIRKYVHVPDKAIKINKERHGDTDMLGISVELPEHGPR